MHVTKTTLFAARLEAYEVTSYAVEGTDLALPWWFSFDITDGGVRIYAWAFLPGVDTFDPIEFVIEERHDIDPGVLDYYRAVGSKALKMASYVGKQLPEAIQRWHQVEADKAA